MTALAHRVLSVAIPSRGDGGATSGAPDASASSSSGGLFRFLFALPVVYLDAARGLRADPPWASRRYVADPAALRAHDMKVARRLLGRHGRDRLAAMFPAHAALLGIGPVEARGATSVTVTVVEPVPMAIRALPAAPLAEVTR